MPLSRTTKVHWKYVAKQRCRRKRRRLSRKIEQLLTRYLHTRRENNALNQMYDLISARDNAFPVSLRRHDRETNNFVAARSSPCRKHSRTFPSPWSVRGRIPKKLPLPGTLFAQTQNTG